MRKPYRVRVIVESSFGERLALLPAGEPVWIIESAINTPVAQRLWAERPGSDHLVGITTFRPGVLDLPEEHLLSILDTIDLHHGHHAADPPYAILEVTGSPPSDRVRDALAEFGFRDISHTSDGFMASRRPQICVPL